jgi:hypothetical protein
LNLIDLLDERIPFFPSNIHEIEDTPRLQMSVTQDLFVHLEDLLNLSHRCGTAVVINGNESSFLVVSIALLVGEFGLESMRQVSDSVIVNRSDDTAVPDYFM